MAKKKNPENARATGAELDLRYDKAQELLTLGLTDRQAEKRLVSTYGISRRTAMRYTAKVYERWREVGEQADGQTMAEKRAKHEDMIRLIILAAARRENLNLQLRAIEMLMKLHGTNQPNKLELTGANGGPIDMRSIPDDELKRLISEAGIDKGDNE